MEKIEILKNSVIDIIEVLESEAEITNNLTGILHKAFMNDYVVTDEYCGTAEYIHEQAIEVHLRMEASRKIIEGITTENSSKVLDNLACEISNIREVARKLYSFVKVLEIASNDRNNRIIIREYIDVMDGIKTQIKAFREGTTEFIRELNEKMLEQRETEEMESEQPDEKAENEIELKETA